MDARTDAAHFMFGRRAVPARLGRGCGEWPGSVWILWLVLLQTAVSMCYAAINVRDHGAKGDKKTVDTPAIQAAVDAAVKKGGDTVVLPPGDYLSGAIYLRSNITLQIEAGATLWASTDPKDYPEKRNKLLLADEAERVSVIGPGAINGQGTADYGDRWGVPDKPKFRVGVLLFENCRDVSIRDLKILYSDSWTLHLKGCERVRIDKVTIRNNYRRLNSDGIDPNSCRDVRITRCDIVAGDDCIVLKSTDPAPCENIVVEDCILESAASALKLGTESKGDFRDIRFSNCTIRNSPTGVGLYLKDGAVMERITFSNLSIETPKETVRTVTPLFIDIEKRHADSPIGKIHDVTFRDIQIRSGSGALLQGMPEGAIQKLTLQNVTFHADWADDYAQRKKPVGGRRTTRDERDTLYARLPSYVTIAHARGLTVENLRVIIAGETFRQFPRSALSLNECDGGVVRNVSREPAGQAGQPPAIALHNCKDMDVADHPAVPVRENPR
ncbi:MAG: glycoside hydrolase family 28 protein [Planctomycetota bacterium]